MNKNLNRREFLKLVGAVSFSTAVGPDTVQAKEKPPSQFLLPNIPDNLLYLEQEKRLFEKSVEAGTETAEVLKMKEAMEWLMETINFHPGELAKYLKVNLIERTETHILTVDTGVDLENPNLDSGQILGVGEEAGSDLQLPQGHGTLMCQALCGTGFNDTVKAGPNLLNVANIVPFVHVLNGWTDRNVPANVPATKIATGILDPNIITIVSALHSILTDDLKEDDKKRYIEVVNDRQKLFIFSAGNSGNEGGYIANTVWSNNRNFPTEHTLAIGALGKNGQPESYTSYKDGKFIDGKWTYFNMEGILFAPGYLPVLGNNNDYEPAIIQGTSPAAHVVAQLAFLIQIINPDLTGVEIGKIIRETAREVLVGDQKLVERYGNKIKIVDFDKAIYIAIVSKSNLYLPIAAN